MEGAMTAATAAAAAVGLKFIPAPPLSSAAKKGKRRRRRHSCIFSCPPHHSTPLSQTLARPFESSSVTHRVTSDPPRVKLATVTFPSDVRLTRGLRNSKSESERQFHYTRTLVCFG